MRPAFTVPTHSAGGVIAGCHWLIKFQWYIESDCARRHQGYLLGICGAALLGHAILPGRPKRLHHGRIELPHPTSQQLHPNETDETNQMHIAVFSDVIYVCCRSAKSTVHTSTAASVSTHQVYDRGAGRGRVQQTQCTRNPPLTGPKSPSARTPLPRPGWCASAGCVRVAVAADSGASRPDWKQILSRLWNCNVRCRIRTQVHTSSTTWLVRAGRLVRVAPGSTSVTRMPVCGSVSAIASLSPSTAKLVLQPKGTLGLRLRTPLPTHC